MKNLLNTLPIDCINYIKKGGLNDKIAIFVGNWTVYDVKEDHKSLYIFGDNNIKKGLGGQAIIRDCVNSVGIPTKKYPNNNPESFYNDDEYDNNCKNIYDSIVNIIRICKTYETIVFPKNGFGTGLADLPRKAPRTCHYLEKIINDVFDIDYADIRKNGLDIDNLV